MNKRIRKKKKNKELLKAAEDIGLALKTMPPDAGLYIEHGHMVTIRRAISYVDQSINERLAIDIQGEVCRIIQWKY